MKITNKKNIKSIIDKNLKLQTELLSLQKNQYELEYRLNQIYNSKSYKLWQKFNDLKKATKDPSYLYELLPLGLKLKVKNIIRQARSKKNSQELGKYKTYLNNNLALLKTKNIPIKEKVSIIIPTKNAGDLFEISIKKIVTQKNIEDLEIIIIDSGSTDNTLNICKKYNLKTYKISPEKFSHSGTRNLGAKYATGEYLVFTVQDAFMLNENTLSEAIHFMNDNDCKVCSSRQIPRSNADVSASFQIKNYTNCIYSKHVNLIININKENFKKLSIPIKRSYCIIDDVFAIYRKNFFEKMNGYDINLKYGEDLDMCQRIINKDKKIAGLFSNGIIHSHNRPISYQFKRSYIDRQLLSNVFKEKKVYSSNKNKKLKNILNDFYLLGKQIERDFNNLSNIPKSIEEIILEKTKSNYKFQSCDYILEIAKNIKIKIENIQTKQNTNEFYDLIKQDYLYSMEHDITSLNKEEIFTLIDSIFSSYCGVGLSTYYLSQINTNQQLKLMDSFLKKGV